MRRVHVICVNEYLLISDFKNGVFFWNIYIFVALLVLHLIITPNFLSFMEIFEDNFEISRTITVGIENSTLFISALDSSEECKYERILETKEIESIRCLLNASTDENLLTCLKDRFCKSCGFELIYDFLRKNKIEFTFSLYLDE